MGLMEVRMSGIMPEDWNAARTWAARVAGRPTVGHIEGRRMLRGEAEERDAARSGRRFVVWSFMMSC